MSARFFCPDPPVDGRQRLGAGEARHLSRVCRLGVGDVVEVFDGRGFATTSKVITVGDDWVELTAVGPPLAERPPPCRLTLASAVPKGDRFDWLVEKATEMGVERLIPIVTDRSVVEPGSGKLSRLRRSIIEASKQCRRNRLMVLDPPMRWSDLAGCCPGLWKFVADPAGLPASRVAAIPHGQAVILAVGPEGGFTASERELADQTGWLSISLSVNTLRIETAGLAGCSALFARAEESNE
ncbi:MAG TPA: RsmE family RNA methyltransferase [Isosphaeraceae bacterium]|nr:RsmE family RNA methyltransferase [Isosphaeraceae bacterium]